MTAPGPSSRPVRSAAWAALALALLLGGCKQKWFAAQKSEAEDSYD